MDAASVKSGPPKPPFTVELLLDAIELRAARTADLTKEEQ
jgi:hypothetical protein